MGWDNESWNELFKVLGVGMEHYSNYMDSQNKIKATNDALVWNQQASMIKKTEERNYTHRYNILKDEREDNEAAIKGIVDDIGRWNINAQDWSKLDDYYKTDEGQKILSDLGVEYGENFRFREKIADNTYKQLDNTAGLIKMQRGIIDHLEGKRDEILNLRPHLSKMRDEGIQGVFETLDYMNYINEHPEIFARTGPSVTTEGDTLQMPILSDYGKSLLPEGYEDLTPDKFQELFKERDKTQSMWEMNELADAWLKNKTVVGGKEYGYYDKAAVDKAETKITKKKAKLKKEMKKDDTNIWEADIAFLLDDIGVREDAMVATSKDEDASSNAKKTVKEFLESVNGPLKGYAGSKDRYSNSITAGKLYDEVARRIYKVMNWEGVMTDMPAGEGTIRSIFESTSSLGVDKQHSAINYMYDSIIPSRQQGRKYGFGGERWATEEMEGIDLAYGRGALDQEQQEEVLFGYIRMHRMLEERYPELALKGLQ